MPRDAGRGVIASHCLYSYYLPKSSRCAYRCSLPISQRPTCRLLLGRTPLSALSADMDDIRESSDNCLPRWWTPQLVETRDSRGQLPKSAPSRRLHVYTRGEVAGSRSSSRSSSRLSFQAERTPLLEEWRNCFGRPGGRRGCVGVGRGAATQAEQSKLAWVGCLAERARSERPASQEYGRQEKGRKSARRGQQAAGSCLGQPQRIHAGGGGHSAVHVANVGGGNAGVRSAAADRQPSWCLWRVPAHLGCRCIIMQRVENDRCWLPNQRKYCCSRWSFFLLCTDASAVVVRISDRRLSLRVAGQVCSSFRPAINPCFLVLALAHAEPL